MPASALPYRLLSGVSLLVAVMAVVEALGRPAGIEPLAFVPIVAAVAVVVGGLRAGALAAALGCAYGALYYVAGTQGGVIPGNAARFALTVVASVAALAATGYLRSRVSDARWRAMRQKALMGRVQTFTTDLANEPADAVAAALVHGAARLLDTDMCVLTLLDPHSGRHHVRAIHGAGASAMGVEVVPGVGVTGQALRERRTVVAASPTSRSERRGLLRVGFGVGRAADRRSSSAGRDPGDAGGGRGPKTGPQAGPQVVAAIPAVQAGRVIATLTVGRSDGRRPFDDDDMAALDLVRPVVTLAVSGSLQRQELEQGSPRDSQTGLYNRAYLDAALEQLLALRRRTAPHERSPLSMILFDLDSFALVNERHSRQVGDTVLRAVSTILRQRFRASDILARVGPDSFYVVLNGADAEVAAEAAAQIRRQVRELNLSNSRGEPVVLSISAGCAMYHDGERPEAFFRNVEAALETARWSGPGAVVSL